MSFSLLASLASAQTVWTVGPPASGADFTNLQTAANAVADGDVLLLRTGTYGNLSLAGKGLTIVADAGETPSIGSATVSALPAGKAVRLQGLAFLRLDLLDCTGTVWVEDCDGSAALVVSVRECASVALLDVRAVGQDAVIDPSCSPDGDSGGDGLFLRNSSVHAYGGIFAGGDAGNDGRCDSGFCVTLQGGYGVRSWDSGNLLFLSGSQVSGGGCSGADFVFCDGVCAGRPDIGSGAVTCAGIGLIDPDGTAHVLDSVLSGAPGYWCFAGSSDAPSEPYYGPVNFLPGTALRVLPLEPVRENATVPIHVEGPPHALVRLGSSDKTWTLPAFELARGTSLLAPSAVATVRTLGVTNAAGVLDATIDAGTLPPGVDAGITFFQPYYVLPERHKLRRIGEPIEEVVLGQATMLVVLDESL